MTYRYTNNHSGNSIVLVSIVKEAHNKELLRNEFKLFNCTSEGLNSNYFFMGILEEVNYSQIKAILDKYELEGLIEYAKPRLSSKHSEDLKN